MSRLKALLRVSDPSTRNTQQTGVQACKAVAQHMHTTQQPLLHVAHSSPCNTQQGELSRDMEARRHAVLAKLEDKPTAQFAMITDPDSDPEFAILAIALRGKATFEMKIPREKYDPFLLYDLVHKHFGTCQ